ncbi:MAG: NAD-dependent epimerase/dehydratase family protein [Planctomycetales bacterium]|nr:NAD-dependent epimerase/dehydratase family protein [Planctomycetales bacterium]
MANVLVTGATGFIGQHLVRSLVNRGDDVTCLVRPSSDRGKLRSLEPNFVDGDLGDERSVREAVEGMDLVFNLAGTTKALNERGFHRANVRGAQMIAKCAAGSAVAPKLVHVSSLAATGPSTASRPRVETDAAAPVSRYGKSKLAGEVAIRQFADEVNVSIVRPPIVLGPGDRDGFQIFKSISTWSLHLIAGLSDQRFSVIHVEDLCNTLLHVADSGQRVVSDPTDHQGVYFAAHDQIPTYAELGQMVARALGKRHIIKLHAPIPMIWGIAAVSECYSQIRRRPHILSLDKVREANAGSWSCDAGKLCRETGFEFPKSLQERIDETARWYINKGWIKASSRQSESSSSHTGAASS